MAAFFLLLAVLVGVVLVDAVLENTGVATATLFNRSFDQLSSGELLLMFAGLGFLLALFLFLAFGASRTRRARRKELKSRRRDAESRVDELERENARLQHELDNTREKLDGVDRNRADAVAERDRAEAAVDRVRAANRDRADAVPEPDRADAAPEPDRTGATAIDDRPQAEGRATAPPPEPASVRRERLDDRTGAPLASDEHARAADEHAQAGDEHARAAADEEARRR